LGEVVEVWELACWVQTSSRHYTIVAIY